MPYPLDQYALLSYSTLVDASALRLYHANIEFVNNFGSLPRA